MGNFVLFHMDEKSPYPTFRNPCHVGAPSKHVFETILLAQINFNVVKKNINLRT